MKKKWLYLASFGGFVIFLLAGQAAFTLTRAFFPGCLFYAAGIALFLVLLAMDGKNGQRVKINIGPKILDLRKTLYLALSVVLSLLVCVTAFLRQVNLAVLALWVVSLVLFLLTFRDKSAPGPRLDMRLVKDNKADIIIFSAIILFAFLARFLFLGSIPWGMNQEESFAGMGVKDILEGRSTDFMGFGPHSAQGFTFYSNVYFLFQSVFPGMFGLNVFALRVFSALTGVLAVAAVFFLARDLFDKATGYMAAFLVASSDILIHFSRFGFPFIQDSLFCALVLLFLLKAVKSHSVFFFAVTGVLTGLSQFFWASSRINIAIVLGFLVLKTVSDRAFFKANVKGMLAMIAGFAMCFLPLILPFDKDLMHITEGADRDFLLGGWAANYSKENIGKSIYNVLFDQVGKSFLSFNLTGDKSYLWQAPWPYLEFFTGIFFIVGLVRSLKNWREDGNLLLLVTFFGGVFALVALTVGAPNYQRMSAIFTVPFLFAASGAKTSFDLGKKLITSKVTRIAAVVLVFGYIGVYGLVSYFGTYTGGRYFHNYRDQANYVGFYIKAKGPGFRYVVPNPYRHFSWTVNFITGNAKDYKIDFMFPTDPVLTDYYFVENAGERIRNMNLEPGTIVILVEKEKDNLQAVQAAYPAAQVEYVQPGLAWSSVALIIK
jgi:4-amino-4-deoxy-L-arabinose transferase-like glycosyltransferase